MTLIDWQGTLDVALGWFTSGTIASNTLLALVLLLVLFWVVSLVPEPKSRSTRGHYWIEQ